MEVIELIDLVSPCKIGKETESEPAQLQNQLKLQEESYATLQFHH